MKFLLTASDVYLDLGFEDLSHFSFTFKEQFGVAPPKLSASRSHPVHGNLNAIT
jgi:AraC-like DNA-binding protein